MGGLGASRARLRRHGHHEAAMGGHRVQSTFEVFIQGQRSHVPTSARTAAAAAFIPTIRLVFSLVFGFIVPPPPGFASLGPATADRGHERLSPARQHQGRAVSQPAPWQETDSIPRIGGSVTASRGARAGEPSCAGRRGLPALSWLCRIAPTAHARSDFMASTADPMKRVESGCRSWSRHRELKNAAGASWPG
jgi:hypothetical protein